MRIRQITMIGLIDFTGEPVMCILILEGENPKGNIDILSNTRLRKYCSGESECVFKEEKVPTFL